MRLAFGSVWRFFWGGVHRAQCRTSTALPAPSVVFIVAVPFGRLHEEEKDEKKGTAWGGL